jgi:hypothetical protein
MPLVSFLVTFYVAFGSIFSHFVTSIFLSQIFL